MVALTRMKSLGAEKKGPTAEPETGGISTGFPALLDSSMTWSGVSVGAGVDGVRDGGTVVGVDGVRDGGTGVGVDGVRDGGTGVGVDTEGDGGTGAGVAATGGGGVGVGASVAAGVTGAIVDWGEVAGPQAAVNSARTEIMSAGTGNLERLLIIVTLLRDNNYRHGRRGGHCA